MLFHFTLYHPIFLKGENMNLDFNSKASPSLSDSLATVTSISSTNKQLEQVFWIVQQASLNAQIFCQKIGTFQSTYDWTKQQIKSKEGSALVQAHTPIETVKEIEATLIKDFCSKYLSSDQKIVELGAGILNKSGHSYLMNRLPEDLRSAVEPTECDIAQVKDSPDGKLKHINSTELAKSYTAASIDRIIGSHFFDSLDQTDLTTTLKQSYAVLKENGLIVHFSLLEPNQNVFTSEFSNEETICFPLMTGENHHFDGLQVISKENFLRFVETTKNVNTKGLQFLKWYANFSPFERELIINDLAMNDSITRNAGALLSKWIQEIKPDGLKVVENKEAYEIRIKNALATTGFKILEFGYREGSHIIERPKGLPERFNVSNHFSMNYGDFSRTTSLVLAPGNVYQSARMLVIVAKKAMASTTKEENKEDSEKVK